jgi:glycosyl hydrolase family 26
MRDPPRRAGPLIDGRRLPRWMHSARTIRVGGVMRQWPPRPPAAPRTRPIYRARWTWAVLGAVVALVASITFVALSESAPDSARKVGAGPTAGTRTAPGSRAPSSGGQPGSSPSGHGIAHAVPLSVYAGQSRLFGVAAFGLATGTLPTFATEYLDKGSWASMTAAANVKAWSPTRYRLVLGVPILPGTGTLAEGAAGAYNQYFTTLGENLVGDKEANAILRLGWEFNGTWFPWSVANATDAANFVGFWRQIVTTMRAVPGQRFKFAWNPNGPSPTTYLPDQAYPGDAYVDYVGTDVYDNFWGSPFTPATAWTHQLTQQWGLNWLVPFAGVHHKPIVVPEWSDEFRTDGHGLGDDPSFIDYMANWFATNKVAFAGIWSFDTSPTYRNNILDGTFPKALAEFKKDFG